MRVYKETYDFPSAESVGSGSGPADSRRVRRREREPGLPASRLEIEPENVGGVLAVGLTCW